MILHTCLHCQASGLYGQELGSEVTCHSCGVPFLLSGFTKVDKTVTHRLVTSAKLKAEDVRQSRRLVYTGGFLFAVFLVWVLISILGLVPDDWRVVNRRFADVADADRLFQAVGLLAVTRVNGDVEFEEYFTVTAIHPGGYLLTSKRAAESADLSQAWAFIGGRRMEVEVVREDSIADIALLKVEEPLLYYFRIAGSSGLSATNAEVTSIGFQDAANIDKPPGDYMCSITRGTIGRRFSNEIGTEWIEHDASMMVDGGGGPLIIAGQLVGLNATYDRGITRAISVAPFRPKIERWIAESEHKIAGGK